MPVIPLAMMLYLLKTVITVLALLATCALLPLLPLGILRFVLRGVGWVIQKRTRSRREYILSRLRADDEAVSSKQVKSSSGTQGEDDDWEKLDSSSSSSGEPGSNIIQENDDWDGIIGFFHPFWYVIHLIRCTHTTVSAANMNLLVTRVAEENVFFGKP
jgi:alpha-1,2-mannosyltransferase